MSEIGKEESEDDQETHEADQEEEAFETESDEYGQEEETDDEDESSAATEGYDIYHFKIYQLLETA